MVTCLIIKDVIQNTIYHLESNEEPKYTIKEIIDEMLHVAAKLLINKYPILLFFIYNNFTNA